jgi:phage head maturation protease
MKLYFPIAKVDADRREVWGYASTEARDDQGEIVKREALVAALGDYMKFANIREMHQLSAVGVAKEAGVDDRGLYVGARIVDDRAWRKVTEGVYKGYSIGGRVTDRDPANYKTITGLVLNEISLVDRPANPEAVFDYWKAAGASTMLEPRFNPPIQIWSCGNPDHRHLGKAEAFRCLEEPAPPAAADSGAKAESEADSDPYGDVEYADPGFQPDGRKRYPIDTEEHIRAAWSYINRPKNDKKYTTEQRDKIKAKIIAAWRAKIDSLGPPAARVAEKASQPGHAKSLWDVGRVAEIILDLDWLAEGLAAEAGMEGDASPQPERLRTIIVELRGFLNALVLEETNEVLEDTEAVGTGPTAFAGSSAMAGNGKAMHKLATSVVTKAGHSREDQALLDLAHHAADACMKIPGLRSDERRHLGEACEDLKAAGARPADAMGADLKPPMILPPEMQPQTAMDAITAALGKRGKGHQALMDLAHQCIDGLTDGQACRAGKLGARHSQETIGHLVEAHGHLVEAGARCGGTDQSNKAGGLADLKPGRAALHDDLAKSLVEERAEKAALLASLSDILPRLDRLAKRVEDIARTPLAPVTIARNITSVSKQQDGIAGETALSQDELAAAFARMSQEEQTLTLIKASHARPIHPAGLAPTVASRES